MTLRQVCKNFWLWLTEPVNPLPLALFRILFGVILILNGMLLYDDLGLWFATGGIFPLSSARSMIGSDRLNVFLWLGDSPQVVATVFWTYMAASALLTIGLFPRRMALLVFIALASFSHRNIYILHSGDTFIRVMSFLMIFAPTGAALSIECKIRGYSLKSINPAAFRAMQFQVCVLYAAALVFKLRGDAWLNGSAVYIVQQLTEFQHFPVPGFLRTPFMGKVQTWGTLLVEGAFPLLVWFRDTRLIVIAGLLILHLGIEYSMNIQLFEWTLVSSLALFLTPSEVRRILWANPSAR
ncbi:hypothetical protein EBZ80_12660 [bacterium]|nr:hypothetical protein [bacterium]